MAGILPGLRCHHQTRGGSRPGSAGMPVPAFHLGPLPDGITIHLDADYDSDKTRTELAARNLRGRIAHKGGKAPIQASRRWHVERTHAWQNAFHRLAHCYEHRTTVINAPFDLADTITTVHNLIRRARTTHRWDDHPKRRP